MAAFVAARAATPPVQVARRTRRPVTKALVGSGFAVVLATGGVSLAATGHLPDVPVLGDLPGLTEQASDRATEAVEAAGSPTRTPSSAAPTSTGSRTAGAEASGSARPDGKAGQGRDAGASPSPNLRGLCTAFQAQAGQSSALDNPAFDALVAAAGTWDAVAAYCATLVGEPKDTGKPDGPGKPDRTPGPEDAKESPKPDKTPSPAPGKPSKTPKHEGGNPGAPASPGGTGSGTGTSGALSTPPGGGRASAEPSTEPPAVPAPGTTTAPAPSVTPGGNTVSSR